MSADERRQEILRIIRESGQPVTGAYLAGLLGVSRQVIVQDIAILRATGEEIIATPQGYIIPKSLYHRRYRRVVACKHSEKEIEDELMTVVDRSKQGVEGPVTQARLCTDMNFRRDYFRRETYGAHKTKRRPFHRQALQPAMS